MTIEKTISYHSPWGQTKIYLLNYLCKGNNFTCSILVQILICMNQKKKIRHIYYTHLQWKSFPIDTKGNILFWNVKTRWSFMFSLAKLISTKYHVLITMIQTKSVKSEVDLKHLNALCNVEFILGFPCILPLLECVHINQSNTKHKCFYLWLCGIYQIDPTRVL